MKQNDLQKAIKVVEELEKMGNVWDESKQDPLLHELLKRTHKLLKPEKKKKKQRKGTTEKKLILNHRVRGSGYSEEQMPAKGECMDSITAPYKVCDVPEHLRELKTSTVIAGYQIDYVKPRLCMICDTRTIERHLFYHLFCKECAELNYLKRTQTISMQGRIVLVTGARIKIGYEIALKLLRSGCTVIGTTRFPKDALRRFALEPDFTSFHDRLSIYSVDFRDLNAVSRVIEHLKRTVSHLDVLINNAAQTVRKPPEFYEHLIQGELTDSPLTHMHKGMLPTLSPVDSGKQQVTQVDLSHSALLSQAKVLPEDEISQKKYFPVGKYDSFGQQKDERSKNSWVLKAHEVHPAEMLECQLINSVVPFMFVSQCKSLLEQSPYPDRYIVNVTAMEGTFYRYKSPNHPHTNMAKASLNMLTRTCAADYINSGIYMNSVDTGWVTDEHPLQYFQQHPNVPAPPLDELDGAMRVLDPIFMGIRDKSYHHGVLFKDYAPFRW
jgi:NAD(P)-dependent dehydrogenase (short-subunit alcohol dehydrogenase family)